MTIVEFLLARISEDEALAEACLPESERHPWGDKDLPPTPAENLGDELRGYLGGTLGEHAAAWHPLRVLADCASKRRLIKFITAQRHVVVEDCWYTCPAATEEVEGETCCNDNAVGCDCGRDYRVAKILGLLAAPYADHVDHDDAWSADL